MATTVYEQTTNPKMFAGGDMWRGADLIVRAALDGRGSRQNPFCTMLGVDAHCWLKQEIAAVQNSLCSCSPDGSRSYSNPSAKTL